MGGKIKEARITIIDDNPKNLQLLGEILGEQGYLIAIHKSGIQALKAINSVLPDLVLLDIMMPGMNGFTLCEKLKASPQTKDIPIIFLSAKNDTEDIVTGFKLGAVDYLTKPFQAEELLQRIKIHIELKRGREKIQSQENQKNQFLHLLCHDLVNPISTINVMKVLLDRDPMNYPQMAENFADSINKMLDIIDLTRKTLALKEDKVVLLLKSINLITALNSALRPLLFRFEDKQVTVVIDVDSGLEIRAEETSLVNSVFSNLFTNALKFSLPNSVMNVTASRKENKVEVCIKDYGIGIPETLLPVLFNVTKKNHRLGTLNETGTGYGMPLIKEFLQAYGGDIDVTSQGIEDFPEDHGTLVKLMFLSSEEQMLDD